jgi:beta-galactosidase/beta-glucuronidase
MSNEIRKLSAILDHACSGDLSGAIDFDWARPAFDDSSWKDVRVPHDWGVENPFDSDKAYGDAFLDVTGVGWYRIKLKIENGKLKIGGEGVVNRASDAEKAEVAIPADGKVYFECDGAMSYAMLYLDGKFIGGWPYGYTRWRVELTKGGGQRQAILPDGEHVIAIRCHNIPDSSRWYTGGGLYRNCRLLICPKDHVVPGTVFITTPEVTARYAKVHVRYRMSESGEKEKTFAVENPRLWDIDDPYLYTIDVEGDRYRYGIRTISFHSDERRCTYRRIAHPHEQRRCRSQSHRCKFLRHTF